MPSGSRRTANLLLCLLVGVLPMGGCGMLFSRYANRTADAPSYFTELTSTGIRYGHNWPDRPCFTIDLPGTAWSFIESSPDNVQWQRGDQVLRIYLTDNRTARFSVANMDTEQILRSFVAYELEYVQPWFEFYVAHTPKTAEDMNGVWMQWGWEGHGGKRRAARVDEPADQRHVIQSLWLDPWVLSLDWATTDLSEESGATPAKIDTLESLIFYPSCFKARLPGSTWGEPAEQKGGSTQKLSSQSSNPTVRRGAKK